MSANGFVDSRSPLAKALGGGIAHTVVTPEKGRLAGMRFALRSLPQSQVGAAVRRGVAFLTEACGWRDEQLYTELGEAQHDIETQAQVLALALIAVPPEGTKLTTATVVPAVMANEKLGTTAADELRTLLEPDEIMWLFREFARWNAERSPITRSRTDAEIGEYIDAMGKGVTPASWLKSCDDATLLRCAIEMASRLTMLTKPSSSPTSPSTSPSNGSSDPSASPIETTDTETAGPTIEVLPVSPSAPSPKP